MLDRGDIIRRMEGVGRRLQGAYDIVAVGGTSLALHGLKEQTRDVDFIVERGDLLKFADAYKETYDGIIHLAEPGTCFSVYMPADYLSYANLVGSFGSVNLYALGMLDTIITKSARFNSRDRSDLQGCADVNTKDLLSRISDYSLKAEHMGNVRAALVDIFGMPREDLDAP